MLNREEVLKNEDLEAIGAALEADVVAFTEELTGKTVDELKTIEQELMDVFKTNDEHLAKVTYELSNEVEYDGVTVKRGDIASKIISLLNNIEVQFQATLGIYQCIRFWKKRNIEPVPYGAYDSTLRLLGTLKFKGEKECFDILVINNWFTSAHAAYTRDNIWTQYLHALHQAILKQMEELENPETEGTPDATV